MQMTPTRRAFLSYAAAFGTAPILPAVAQKTATVTMGVITPTTGTFAYAGDLVARGAALALEMHGSNVLGTNVRLLTRKSPGSRP